MLRRVASSGAVAARLFVCPARPLLSDLFYKFKQPLDSLFLVQVAMYCLGDRPGGGGKSTCGRGWIKHGPASEATFLRAIFYLTFAIALQYSAVHVFYSIH
jgi:hypothetical protein